MSLGRDFLKTGDVCPRFPYGVPTNVVMLSAGNAYVKELEDTGTFACGARLRLADVIHGVTVENAGAFDRLNVRVTAELE